MGPALIDGCEATTTNNRSDTSYHQPDPLEAGNGKVEPQEWETARSDQAIKGKVTYCWATSFRSTAAHCLLMLSSVGAKEPGCTCKQCMVIFRTLDWRRNRWIGWLSGIEVPSLGALLLEQLPAFARDRRGSEHGDHTGPRGSNSGKKISTSE